MQLLVCIMCWLKVHSGVPVEVDVSLSAGETMQPTRRCHRPRFRSAALR